MHMTTCPWRTRKGGNQGFSLIELLVSVSILTILMAAVFQFLAISQRRYRSQQLISEVSQGGRSAFEIMSQELNQAGYNPPFLNSKKLAAAANANGSQVVSVQLGLNSGDSSSPNTQRIFYGTRLVIGKDCDTSTPPICTQEEVVVNSDSTYGSTAIAAGTIPVVLTNNHAINDPVYSRNYPYPSGILYNHRTAGVDGAVADNKILFFGDINDTGHLYYGEYRLQCPGTTLDACTSGCMAGPFVLTRFMTKLADSNGIFKIPASKAAAYDGAAASPLVDNITGTCASLWSGGYTWPFNAPDETAPGGTTAVSEAKSYTGPTDATGTTIDPVINPDGTPTIWFKMNTYGAVDTTVTPNVAYFQSFVKDIRITLTVQQSMRDTEVGQFTAGAASTPRQQRLQTHIVPRNINDAMALAQGGASLYLPPIPRDPSHDCTGTSPNISCPTLPLP